MKTRSIRIAFSVVFFVAGLLTCSLAWSKPAPPPATVESFPPARVLAIRLDGSVNPGSADYIKGALNRAAADGYDAFLLELDTPGGLLESTRDIVKAFLASPIPVIVYVAPSGARAGSAGVMITLAANLAAMAPGSNIGAAHPVAGGGEEMDKEMSKKVTNDAVAWIEGIAEQRGRNREWAAKAVRDSVSVTATDALENNVIDLIADNRTDLLNKIDSRTVVLSGDKKVVLHTKNAMVVELQKGLKHKVLMLLADPNIAYIFMVIGFLGIYAEFSHPGMIFPGVAGGVCFLLFLMSTQILPINIVGVILILAGLGLFVAEIKFTSYGALTVGGGIALALGSLFLFDVPEKVVGPDFSFGVSLKIILPSTIGLALIVLLITTLVIRTHRRRMQTGEESLVGSLAVVAVDIKQGHGRIKMMGTYWNAVSTEDIVAGTKVKITLADGSTMTVVPAGEAGNG